MRVLRAAGSVQCPTLWRRRCRSILRGRVTWSSYVVELRGRGGCGVHGQASHAGYHRPLRDPEPHLVDTEPEAQGAAVFGPRSFAGARTTGPGPGEDAGLRAGPGLLEYGPVADATVTAWHVDTARTRTAVSGADGRYRFSGLAVGRYAVTAVVGNWQTSTVIAEVNVGEGTVVDLRVESPRTVEEVVVVRESVPAVDVTRSETTRIVTAGDIERLPVTRDPNAVVLMAPGGGLRGRGVRHGPPARALRRRLRLRVARRRLRGRKYPLHQRHERDEPPQRTRRERGSVRVLGPVPAQDRRFRRRVRPRDGRRHQLRHETWDERVAVHGGRLLRARIAPRIDILPASEQRTKERDLALRRRAAINVGETHCLRSADSGRIRAGGCPATRPSRANPGSAHRPGARRR